MKKEIIVCNLHDDCDHAEEMAKLEGKPRALRIYTII